MKRPLYSLRVESIEYPAPGFQERVVHGEVGGTDEAALLRSLKRVRWTPRMHAVAGNAATEALLLRLSIQPKEVTQ